MKGFEKQLRSLMAWLRTLGDDGVLESGQAEAAVKAVKRLRHALRTHDRHGIETTVDEIARIFLRVIGR